jgi:hypothetical protein
MAKKISKISQEKNYDFSMFTDKDGYLKGGIDVEMSSNSETQEEQVQGQERMLPEKRRKAKWY